MNKSLYIILIIFLGLTTASGIWDFIIRLRIGPEMYTFDSYISWFLVGNITAIAGALLLLKYYYHQNYRFAFFTGIIAVIASLGYTTVIYIILSSGELRSYYIPALVINLCAIVIYAISLIVSNTRKRFWLNLAGICGLMISLILAAAIIIKMHPEAIGINGILVKLVEWAPVAWCLVNVMFIMNFLGEIRTLKAEHENTSRQQSLESILGFIASVAFIITIALGVLLTNESNKQLSDRNYNSAQARQLVKLAGGARTFVDGKGDSLHYLLIKPQDYDQQKKYPLVVCLPYGGYEAGAAELLSAGVCRSTYPAFIFVPYCPEGQGWGGIPGVPSLDLLVYKTINALTEPGIDVKRRYVTGVSRGGYGTWKFICTRPDMFAAAMPVCGDGDPKLAAKIVNMPIWAFHGAKDRNVPVSGSRDIIAAIRKAGGHTEYPDEGHDIWGKVSDTPGLWNWLFTQKRE